MRTSHPGLTRRGRSVGVDLDHPVVSLLVGNEYRCKTSLFVDIIRSMYPAIRAKYIVREGERTVHAELRFRSVCTGHCKCWIVVPWCGRVGLVDKMGLARDRIVDFVSGVGKVSSFER